MDPRDPAKRWRSSPKEDTRLARLGQEPFNPTSPNCVPAPKIPPRFSENRVKEDPTLDTYGAIKPGRRMTMRLWLGEFKQSRRRGRNWNIGVHVYEDERIPVANVIRAIQETLNRQFPTAEMVISPSIKRAL